MRTDPPTWLLMIVVFLSACASSNIDSRKAERLAAYNKLSAEEKGMVDRGQIKVGMSEDAVYIAWGRPSQVLQAEDAEGPITTWLYHGQWMEETRYWSYREVSRDGVVFLERYLDRDYNPRDYVRAEITFMQGTVIRWRTLPQPLN